MLTSQDGKGHHSAEILTQVVMNWHPKCHVAIYDVAYQSLSLFRKDIVGDLGNHWVGCV